MYYKAVHVCAMLNVAYSSFNFAPTTRTTYNINSNKSVNLENVIVLSIKRENIAHYNIMSVGKKIE